MAAGEQQRSEGRRRLRGSVSERGHFRTTCPDPCPPDLDDVNAVSRRDAPISVLTTTSMSSLLALPAFVIGGLSTKGKRLNTDLLSYLAGFDFPVRPRCVTDDVEL